MDIKYSIRLILPLNEKGLIEKTFLNIYLTLKKLPTFRLFLVAVSAFPTLSKRILDFKYSRSLFFARTLVKIFCQRFAACKSGGLRKPKLSVKH